MVLKKSDCCGGYHRHYFGCPKKKTAKTRGESIMKLTIRIKPTGGHYTEITLIGREGAIETTLTYGVVTEAVANAMANAAERGGIAVERVDGERKGTISNG